MGFQATVSAGFSSSTAIGSHTVAGQSNSIILGNNAMKVGINDPTPATIGGGILELKVLVAVFQAPVFRLSQQVMPIRYTKT